MKAFYHERQAILTWLVAACIGVFVAFMLGIVQYHSFGFTVDHRSFGWNKVGFAINGELATIGLIALAYMAIIAARLVAATMGIRLSYR